jgi:hypothetical protein
LLLLAAFFNGFFMTVGQVQMAIAPDLVPNENLGGWFGILGFFRGIINIISPIICGYLWDNVSPSSVFIFLIFTTLIGTSILLTVPTSITK